MSMRDKIADILVEADAEYRGTGEGPSSNAMADAIMELVQARIDTLEEHLAAVIASYDEYRADEYDVGLHGVDTAIHHARAALKGKSND